MHNILRNTALSAGLLIAGELVSGCGGAPSDPVDQATTAPASDSFGVKTVYTSDGKRITTYDDINTDTIYAYCDGSDLVEFPDGGSYDTSVITRSVGHAACADGILTASDFPVPSSQH